MALGKETRMTLNTCSGIISFSRELENKSASFYQDLSRKYTKDEAFFLSLAQENKKNIINIERAYYGVITDAIEGCFAFNINPDEYTLETGLAGITAYPDTLAKAITMEETIIKFYTDAAEQSKSLMADVPRAFNMVAKKRNSRTEKLRSLRTQ
jgi:hypothetical protein